MLLLKSYKLTRVYGTGPCLILLSILPNHQHTWIKVEEQRWLLINNLVCSWVREGLSLFLSTSHLLFLTHSFILNLACSLSVSQSLTHSHSFFLAPSFSLTKFPVSHFLSKDRELIKIFYPIKPLKLSSPLINFHLMSFFLNNLKQHFLRFFVAQKDSLWDFFFPKLYWIFAEKNGRTRVRKKTFVLLLVL